MIGREIYAGKELADRTVGALFVGKFFNSDFTAELGRFTISLDHNKAGIEQCGQRTNLLGFKLIMNFYTGARLVLVKPGSVMVDAAWYWDDPFCPDGNCPLIDYEDYEYYLALLNPETPPNPDACDDAEALIAEVPAFGLRRQWFGSYGTRLRRGLVSGYLVHTPIISPAIFGSLHMW